MQISTYVKNIAYPFYHLDYLTDKFYICLYVYAQHYKGNHMLVLELINRALRPNSKTFE